MKGLIQRVSFARVTIAGEVRASIGRGILLLLAIQKHDNQGLAEKLLHKVLAYRIFDDAQGRMNLSLDDSKGELLIISQFTLAANTSKGLRPSFSSAAPPELAEYLYRQFVDLAIASGQKVASGVFGADMQVQLLNDGPVTFLLEV